MPPLQERYFEILMDRVRYDKFPSHQLLDKLETAIATPEQFVRYTEMLIENVQTTRYPSHQLLERIQRMMLVGARAA
jgi:hypothetical protein